MKRKIIILLVLLIITCGCSSTVNINITEDFIEEDINVNYFIDNETTKEMIPEYFRDFIPAYGNVILPDAEPDEKIEGTAYYNKKMTDIGSGYSFNYNYRFKQSEYSKARSVKKAFRSFNILKDPKEQTITISTDSEGIELFNLYDNLSEIVINIKTDYQVLETNGTKNGNIYTWHFTANDHNKNIYLVMKKKTTGNGEDNNETKPPSTIVVGNNDSSEEGNFFTEHPLLIVILAILAIIVVAIVLSKISSRKYQK